MTHSNNKDKTLTAQMEETTALEQVDTERRLLRVGITHGDTNGVGYEIIFKLFADGALLDLCIPIIYGASKVAAFHRKALNLNTNYRTISNATQAESGQLHLINCIDQEIKVEMGHGDAESGRAAFVALERATKDLKEGKIDVLVTAPICKSAIQSAEFKFAGHTEYLANRLGDDTTAPLMILANEVMRVALVTTHLPVAHVAENITKELIEEKIKTFYHSLRRDFLLSAPRIAVLGLNPHNGDDGVLGEEEQNIIAPAIQAASEEGIPVFGPYAADGFFGAAMYTHFDGVLAMYHDQGLVPLKTLSMDDGINFTAGLPFVRTSPDHGTAFDIAGKGIASENALRQAIYAAIDIYHHRVADDLAHANPLPKLYHERREDGERKRFVPNNEQNEPRETTNENTEATATEKKPAQP